MDGPAIERLDGTTFWYFRGELHRIDGPAAEYDDGSKQWWVSGVHILSPYSHVLTGAFARGFPISPEVLSDMVVAMLEVQNDEEHIGRLKTILIQYWPVNTHEILAKLFMDSDHAIKHLAFALLGREARPHNISSTLL